MNKAQGKMLFQHHTNTENQNGYAITSLIEQKNELERDLEFFSCYPKTQGKIQEIENELYEINDTLKKLSINTNWNIHHG